MRRQPLILVALLALLSSFFAYTASSAAAVDYSQPAFLVREKHDTFGSSVQVGMDGQGWTYAKSNHDLEMRVFRVKEELPKRNIYILEVTLKRNFVQRPHIPYAWKEVKLSTPKSYDKRIKATSYSQSLKGSNKGDDNCYNVSASLNAGIGPISGGLNVSRALFCDPNDKTRIAFHKTNFREARWRLHQSGAVKTAIIQKIVKIPANTRVPFTVRTKAPCHYTDQFGEWQAKTCYSKRTLWYPAHR